jgi:hypothetical protein
VNDDEDRPEFPPTRTITYLAALITDLPSNSVVVVMSRSRLMARAEYQNILDRLDRDLIAVQVRVNGKERTTLVNGTRILVDSGGVAGRVPQCDLLLLASSPEHYDQELAVAAALTTNSRRGTVRAIVQDVDIVADIVRDGSGEPLRTTIVDTYGYSAEQVARGMAAIFGEAKP